VIAKSLVSIVIPAYNASATIGILLSSIKKQTYPNIETIVVNDASRDNTLEIIKSYRVKVYENKINLGMTKTRNLAARNAQGKYVLFLDSDMELIANVIEECVKACEQEGLDALMVPERSKGEGFWVRCRGLDKRLSDYDLNRSASRFFKREVLEQIGEHDSALVWGEDFDFENRMRSAGFKYAVVKEVFLYHHEVSNFGLMIKKAYNYGKSVMFYIKKSPVKAAKQFSLFRFSHIKNCKILLKDPLAAIGLVALKISQYAAALCGISVYFVKKFIFKSKGAENFKP